MRKLLSTNNIAETIVGGMEEQFETDMLVEPATHTVGIVNAGRGIREIRYRNRPERFRMIGRCVQGGSWVMGHIWVWVMGRPTGQNPWVSVGVGQCRDPH